MLVFLQSLLLLRRVLVEWFMRRLGADSPAENDAHDEDEATAEYDEERGVVFYPPVYAQRYAAVSDLLRDPRWAGRLEKVVDMGNQDMSFIKYLKEVPGVRTILAVDLDNPPVTQDLFQLDDPTSRQDNPLKVVLFKGNAADPDYRLIGCDAVVSIEMVEHMQPHDLERLVHTVFGFIRPWVAIFTTPNADFNVLFKAMLSNGFRHWDHRFEWTREQFNDWCSNIVLRYPEYAVWSQGVGPGPPGTAHHGCCTQLALFVSKDYQKRADLTPDALALVTKMHPTLKGSRMSTDLEAGDNEELMGLRSDLKLNCSTFQVKRFSETSCLLMAESKPEPPDTSHTREVIRELRQLTQMLNLNQRHPRTPLSGETVWNNINWGEDAPYWNQYYNIVKEYEYPFQGKSSNEKILDLISDEIHRMVDRVDEDEWFFERDRLEIPMERLMPVVMHITHDVDNVRELLEWNGYEISDDKLVYSRVVSDEESKTDEWNETTNTDVDVI